RRRAVVRLYTEAFAGQDALEVPVERSDVEHAWHLYVLRLREEALRIDRNVFIDELKQRNIGTSVHFIPIHVHPYYRDKYGYRPGSFHVDLTNDLCLDCSPMKVNACETEKRCSACTW